MDFSTNETQQKSPWKKYGPAAAIILLLCVCLCAIGFLTWNWSDKSTANSIHLISGCQPVFSGANGHGSAELACSPSYNPESSDITPEEIQDFYDTVTYKMISGTDGSLSNGETITFQAEYDAELAKKLGLNVTDTQSVYKVSGLPDSFEKWSDFSQFDRDSIDDLAARAIINYFKDLYGDRVRIDGATLSAKYLTSYDKNGLPYTDLNYIVKVVYTREVWGFFSTKEQTTSAYYNVSIPELNPTQSKDYSLEGSKVTVTPISADIQTDSEVRDWFITLYPNAVDIFS